MQTKSSSRDQRTQKAPPLAPQSLHSEFLIQQQELFKETSRFENICIDSFGERLRLRS